MDAGERQQIAARIRGLIAGQSDDLADTARHLRVDELSLRMSVDANSPYPTVDVIAAVVREYGVDPSWLLTGTYDSATHRRALDATTAELPAAVNELVHLRSSQVQADAVRALVSPPEPRSSRLDH